jgi:hypothetical protein
MSLLRQLLRGMVVKVRLRHHLQSYRVDGRAEFLLFSFLQGCYFGSLFSTMGARTSDLLIRCGLAVRVYIQVTGIKHPERMHGQFGRGGRVMVV